MVPPQYDEYIKYSKLAHDIYYRYTDLVEPFGMDECWLDFSDSMYPYKSAMEIAEQIRTSTREELGLTVSIGVSFNKIFAKLGSDMKKTDAITEITEANFREKVWPLAADEMIYCGPATMRKLENYGIHTIGQLAATPPDLLRNWFSVNGLALCRYANGYDQSRVMPKDFVSPVKSIGHGITCNADLENEEEVFKVMLELAQDVGHRLRVHGLAARGVQIWIRGNDLSGFQCQCKLPVRTRSCRAKSLKQDSGSSRIGITGSKRSARCVSGQRISYPKHLRSKCRFFSITESVTIGSAWRIR